MELDAIDAKNLKGSASPKAGYVDPIPATYPCTR